MTLGRMNPTYSTAAEVCLLTGYAYFNNGAAPAANTIIQQVRSTVPISPTGQQLSQTFTLAPDNRVTVVLNPTTAYHPAVAPNASTSVVLLDCRAFPAGIIMAQGAYAPPPAATAGNLPALSAVGVCSLLAVDNVNKFIYFGFTTPSGTALVPQSGACMQFDVAFKDTLSL